MNSLSGRTILIADDERYITTTLATKLRQAGATVIIANDGQEAFSLTCEHHPDIVVTDHQMPSMSGLELCRQLGAREDTARIPIVMLSAHGDRLSLAQMSLKNVRLLVLKPFGMKDLLSKLEALATDVRTPPNRE